MHNGHSTWKSNDMVLFKGAYGNWQFDRMIKNDTENDDDGECPSSTMLMSHTRTFPVEIESLDGLFTIRK